MSFRSGRATALCATFAAGTLLAGVGTAAALAAPSAPSAPSAPTSIVGEAVAGAGTQATTIPADVRGAVAAGPVEVIVAFDSAAGLRQMRAATRAGFSRATRQSATDSAAAAFATVKLNVLSGASGLSVQRDYAQLPVQLVRVESPAALDLLASTAGVVSVSLPKTFAADAASNLELIGQPAAAAAGRTGAGTRVAIIDTGVDYNLPLVGTTFGDCTGGVATGTCRIKEYVDVTGATPPGAVADLDSTSHHGTNVSGIVAGVAPAADIAVYAVGGATGIRTVDILSGLDRVAASAAATNTRSVNLSLGFRGQYNTTSCAGSAFTGAFATLRGLGVVPVVSAGNSAYSSGIFSSGISEPACVPGAVSVGAVWWGASSGPYLCQSIAPAADQVACFSQTGPLLSILAPGVDITAAGITMSGTSQAAPHVAAAVAILGAANPAANTPFIVNALTSSGPVIVDNRTVPATSVHRLDLVAAVTAVTTLTVPDAPIAATAIAGNATITASWLSSLSNGGSLVTGYTATAAPSGLACAINGALTCAIVGLPNGVAQTVTVTATNATGLSAASLPSLAATPVGPPAVLAAPAAIAGNALATISWIPGDTGGSPVTNFRATATPGGAVCDSIGASCVVVGLANGTAYTFTVTATNALGTSAASAASAAAIPATVPSAPLAPIGTGGDRQVTASWSVPASIGGSAVTAYTAVATPGGAACSTIALSCPLTGLLNGISYTFVVTATNGVGLGAASAPSAPALAATVSGQPLKVSAARGHLLAVVTWAPPADGGSVITSYRVAASPGGRSCTATVAARCVVTGLVNGRAYRFTVTASNQRGPGATSAASPAVKPAPVPGVPSRLKAVRGNARATISWAAPGRNGTAPITGYRVVATPGGRSCTSARALACTITGLVNGRSYNFAVVAINRVGAGPASASTAATPAGLPGKVRGLRAAYPAANQTVLSWVPPTVSGGFPINRYEVRTSADNGRRWSRWVSVGMARSAMLAGMAKGRAYVIEVRAATSAGVGAGLRLGVRPTR